MTEVEFSRILPLEEFRARSIEKVITATAAECEKLAHRLQLLKVESLKAKLTASRESSGIIVVTGELEAKIEKACGKTLEPLSIFIKAPFEVHYITSNRMKYYAQEHDIHAVNGPDLLETDYLDLGEIVAQSLSLEIDPFVSKEDMI